MKMPPVVSLLARKLGDARYAGSSEWNFKCPFCAERGFASGLEDASELHYNARKSAAICHRCDYRTKSTFSLIRDVFGYIPRSEFINAPVAESGAYIKEIDRLLHRSDGDVTQQKISDVLPEEYERLTLPARGYAKAFVSYCRFRGLDDDDIREASLGFCRTGLYAGYLIFPVFAAGEPVYFTSRGVLGVGGPKSRNPKGLSKGVYLYNADRVDPRRTVYLCEGPFDALAFGSQGVALLGKTITNAQVRLLEAITQKELCVCLDPEESENTKLIAADLSQRISANVSYLILENGDDPADARKKGVLKDQLKNRRKVSFLGMVADLLGW